VGSLQSIVNRTPVSHELSAKYKSVDIVSKDFQWPAAVSLGVKRSINLRTPWGHPLAKWACPRRETSTVAVAYPPLGLARLIQTS
jgi:hypothetical protein